MTQHYFLFQQLFLKNFRNLLIWIGGWLLLAFFLTSVYNSFAENQETTQSVLDSIPQGLASTFNIDDNYLSQVETFASGQFLALSLLIGGIFAGFVGAGLVSSKIEERTIMNYLSLPVSRFWYFSLATLVNLLFFLIANILICLGLFALANFLTNQEEVSLEYFIYLFIGILGVQLFFLGLSQFLGMLLDRGQVVAINSGFAVATWFLDGLYDLANLPDFGKFFLPFYYFDIQYLSNNFELDWSLLWVLFFSAIIFWIAGLILYLRKSIYL